MQSTLWVGLEEVVSSPPLTHINPPQSAHVGVTRRSGPQPPLSHIIYNLYPNPETLLWCKIFTILTVQSWAIEGDVWRGFVQQLNLSEENAADTLILADLHSAEKLKDITIIYINA